MGCGGSKATNEKIALTDEDRRVINDIAATVMKNSVQFQNTIQTVAPLKIHPNAPHMMNDPREVYTFFKKDELPPQLAGGKFAIVKMAETMRLTCQQECAKVLVQRLQQQQKNVDDGVKARYQNIVNSEADKTMSAVIEKYIADVLAGNSTGIQAPLAPAQRSPANPNLNNTTDGQVSRQPSQPPNRSASVANNTNQVVLPAGNWVLAEGSPFYWSEDERLFYHPDSAQFYDPETNKWYDPERQEWYDEDEQ